MGRLLGLLLVLVLAKDAAAQFVQKADGDPTPTGANVVTFVTFPAATQPGNSVVFCAGETAATFEAVQDSAGTTYTQLADITQGPSSLRMQCWFGTPTVGVTQVGVAATTANSYEMIAVEYTGQLVLDSVQTNTGSTATITCLPVTPVCPNELLVAYMNCGGQATNPSFTARSTIDEDLLGDSVITTTTTATASTSISTWGCIAMLFKQPNSCPTSTSTTTTTPEATTTSTTSTTTVLPATTHAEASHPTTPPSESNACCSGLFPSGTCNANSVCNTAQTSCGGGAFNALQTITRPLTGAAPLVAFTGAPVTLSGVLSVTLFQNPINNTKYVLMTAATSFVGSFSSVQVTFAGPSARALNPSCITTTPSQTTTEVSVTAVVSASCGGGSGGLPLWVFIIAAVGGIILLALIILVIVLVVRSRRKRHHEEESGAYYSRMDDVDHRVLASPTSDTTEMFLPEVGNLMNSDMY